MPLIIKKQKIPAVVSFDSDGMAFNLTGFDYYFTLDELYQIRDMINDTILEYEEGNIDDDCVSEINKRINDEQFGYLKEETRTTRNINKDYLYLIHNEELGFYKIGRSKNPNARIKNLNCASAYHLELLYSLKGFGYMEPKIHEKFKHLRVNGEWFSCKEEIEIFFKDLLLKNVPL